MSAGPEVAEEPGHSGTVARVLRILPASDGLRQQGAALEEEDQHDGAGEGDVDEVAGGGQGEEVENQPEQLLGQVVGVAADGEQAPGDEAQAVGRLHRLPTPQLAVLLVLEILLVRVVNINTRLFQIVIK